MDMKTIVFALITFFHDLFTVIWMGGLVVAVLSYLPAVKEALGPGPQVKKVMAAYQKRQSVWVYLSMAGLILTGLLMGRRSPEFEELFAFGNPYSAALSVKHLLVIAMIAISLYRSLVLGRARRPANSQKERLNYQLLLVNAALAVLVLLASGLVSAFTLPAPAG